MRELQLLHNTLDRELCQFVFGFLQRQDPFSSLSFFGSSTLKPSAHSRTPDQSSGFMSEPQPTWQNTPPAVRLCGSFRGAQAAGIAVDLTTHSSDFWRFPRSQTTLKSRCYFPGPLLRPTTSQQAPSTLVSSMVGSFRPEQPYTPDPCSMLAHRILDHSGSMIR